jgi:hypothetical protein
VPPVVRAANARAYRDRIMAALPKVFRTERSSSPGAYGAIPRERSPFQGTMSKRMHLSVAGNDPSCRVDQVGMVEETARLRRGGSGRSGVDPDPCSAAILRQGADDGSAGSSTMSARSASIAGHHPRQLRGSARRAHPSPRLSSTSRTEGDVARMAVRRVIWTRQAQSFLLVVPGPCVSSMCGWQRGKGYGSRGRIYLPRAMSGNFERVCSLHNDR